MKSTIKCSLKLFKEHRERTIIIMIGAVRMLKAKETLKTHCATQKKWTELSNNRNSQIALFTVQIQKINWRQRSIASHTKLLSTVNINSVMSVYFWVTMPFSYVYGAYAYILYTTIIAASRRIRCHQHINAHTHNTYLPTNKKRTKWNIRTKY